MTNIFDCLNFLESQITSSELPEDIFLFFTKHIPIVNVDLIVKDGKKTLLSWRNDKYFGSGWHIPGGTIRFKETLEQRIKKVAKLELKTKLKDINPVPIKIHEFILKQEERGHFISFLFECYLPKNYVIKNVSLKETDNGFLKWHDKCPKDLLKVHEIYKKYI